MASISAWRDFYIMGGAALATLMGLLFVAVSIHLREILEVRPLVRNIEAALYGMLFQLAFCGFMLAPGVTLWEAGALVMLAGVLFAIASIWVSTRRSRFDTAVNAMVGVVSAAIGIALMLGVSEALYLYAAMFGLSVFALIRLCWRLLTMALVGLADRWSSASGDGAALVPRASSSR